MSQTIVPLDLKVIKYKMSGFCLTVTKQSQNSKSILTSFFSEPSIMKRSLHRRDLFAVEMVLLTCEIASCYDLIHSTFRISPSVLKDHVVRLKAQWTVGFV